jgi:catechol 2,3-dioxygenase-like lactoylglutathione lyase family enzyme
MLTFGVVVLGVADRARAEQFWCAALGYQVRDDGFGGWARVLVPPGGAGTMIAFQASETPPDEHPRHHLDLHVASAAEQEAEAARLVSLGARRVDWDRFPDDPDFIVLADTEGNRFCIVDLGHDHAES